MILLSHSFRKRWLSTTGKVMMDKLMDDSINWRKNDWNLWIESRNSDDFHDYPGRWSIVSRHPRNSELIMWHCNGRFFLRFKNSDGYWYNKITTLDKILLYPIVKYRVLKTAMRMSEEKVILKLKGYE